MLPQPKGQRELGPPQLFPGMRASTYPQAGRGPRTSLSVDPQLSQQHRYPNNRNRCPLRPGKVPDSNKNSSLKISESKGYQRATLMSRGNPVCRPVGESLLCLRTKAPSVTSSSRFRSAPAPCVGHLSKPQVHPRAAKTTTKPRDTVSA